MHMQVATVLLNQNTSQAWPH